ncbi:hypothetical protein HAL1_08579, partial [Halomonas sp. HAL1]
AIARLYQAIAIACFASARLDPTSREQLLITRKAIEHFLDTLGSAFIHPSQHIPDIPAFKGYADLPGVEASRRRDIEHRDPGLFSLTTLPENIGGLRS